MYVPTNFSQASVQIQHHSFPEKLLKPLRQWLDSFEVHNPQLARWLCRIIPNQCPFARDIKLFGQILFHIPPLCKLNPLYDNLMALRFRALLLLAENCGEDVRKDC